MTKENVKKMMEANMLEFVKKTVNIDELVLQLVSKKVFDCWDKDEIDAIDTAMGKAYRLCECLVQCPVDDELLEVFDSTGNSHLRDVRNCTTTDVVFSHEEWEAMRKVQEGQNDAKRKAVYERVTGLPWTDENEQSLLWTDDGQREWAREVIEKRRCDPS